MKNKEIEELLKGMRDVSNTEGCSMNLDRYLVKLLLSYIEQLEKKVDQYENPDDLTLFYMWLDTKAKDKMKQLEEEKDIEEYNYNSLHGAVVEIARELKIKDPEFTNTEIIIDAINKLQNNRDKAIEYMQDFIFEPLLVQEDRKLIMYNENLRNFEKILKGDSDE